MREGLLKLASKGKDWKKEKVSSFMTPNPEALPFDPAAEPPPRGVGARCRATFHASFEIWRAYRSTRSAATRTSSGSRSRPGGKTSSTTGTCAHRSR